VLGGGEWRAPSAARRVTRSAAWCLCRARLATAAQPYDTPSSPGCSGLSLMGDHVSVLYSGCAMPTLAFTQRRRDDAEECAGMRRPRVLHASRGCAFTPVDRGQRQRDGDHALSMRMGRTMRAAHCQLLGDAAPPRAHHDAFLACTVFARAPVSIRGALRLTECA